MTWKAATSAAVQLRQFYDTYWRPDPAGPFHQPGSGPVPRGVTMLLQRHLLPGARCVDVGCGDGRAGAFATERGSRYVGVDISERAVAAARARGLDARRIDGSDALPFAEDSFDVALCLDVIEHVVFPDQTIREILRVLRPGGIAIVTTPNVAYWRRRLDLMVLGRWNPFGYGLAVEQPWADPHLRFFNPGSLRRLLQFCGFAPVRLGAHSGTLLGDLPWIGRRLNAGRTSALYALLEGAMPSLFGCVLNAVASKPAVSAAS